MTCKSASLAQSPRRAVVVGATSGIGQEVARLLAASGWRVGIAGRRAAALEDFRRHTAGYIEAEVVDVTRPDATRSLSTLIDRLGGMDLFFLSSGIGSQNRALAPSTELDTVRTNAEGFVRMVTFAFNYFKARPAGGHIAVISSIAGTKGLGAAPAYSATKRFQNTYIDALAQLAHMERLPLVFTDIRPGFVDTPLLKSARYPMLMQPATVAHDIVRALERKQRVVIIDRRYRWLVFFWQLIPRWLWERLRIG